MDTFLASTLIKQEALRLGFSACGICRPGFVNEHATYLQEWLKHEFHGEMSYMNKHLGKRINSQLLVENSQSVIITALNYYPKEKQHPKAAQIAYYAYGKDYHLIVKERLQSLLSFINENVCPTSGRVFCDTAPLMEKYHAQQSGLGWIGKNTQLIIPGKGSYFFLGAILLDIPLHYDKPEEKNRCGSCTKCIDACPTQALVAPGQLNANQCLSYLTIEYKGKLPDFFAYAAGKKVYGCDICNQVCPWNQAAQETTVEDFWPDEILLNLTVQQIERMDEREFDHLFKESAIHRIGLKQLQRNLNTNMDTIRSQNYTIQQATTDDCPLIRNLASQVWEPTYGLILSVEQLKYMFEWMYSIESLQKQMTSGHVFFILYESSNPIGYLSVEKEDEHRFHLQKIYILPSQQGKGFGHILLEKAESYIREQQPNGPVCIILNVNRYNKAKLFYEKQGFVVEREGDFEIGNGYFMNDYVMLKKL